MFLVIKAGNLRAVGFKMVRQHIVDIAGQRYLAATDNIAYGLYRGVKILADIDHFARSGGYSGCLDEQRFVIRLFTFIYLSHIKCFMGSENHLYSFPDTVLLSHFETC